MRVRNGLAGVVMLAAVAGCSWFGDDDEPEEIKPNPLPSINQEVKVDVIWSKKIGKGADDRAVRIRPAISGGRIFAASADGSIKALTADTGQVIWDAQIKRFYSKDELAQGFTKDLDAITGGVGAGGDIVVVGTASGDVIAINQSDGTLAWKTATSSEVLAPPQIDGDLVILQTIDGKVTAYDAIDGESRWVYMMNTPPLTLRGTATPMIRDEIVIAAFANGRVAFLDRDRGLAAYDQRVAISQGSTDLERLVDIDGAMQIVEGKLYVASFQGRLVAIDINSGGMIWAEEVSSIEGVGAGFGNIYAAKADSQITAYNASNGREIWNVDALLHREITSPVTSGSYLIFTDFEGYAHVMAQSDGRFVGRRKIDGSGVKAGIVESGGRLYAMTDSGTLTAIEIR
ncbi:MAG: outer membrane protein assembly factor BamB [Gammaproteobacteria bacterium]|jgi:outer membrane protein assembly factor BamB|nr:outer membrane protein assembly factor BamB [Gammaproteobacteria bacterium]